MPKRYLIAIITTLTIILLLFWQFHFLESPYIYILPIILIPTILILLAFGVFLSPYKVQFDDTDIILTKPLNKKTYPLSKISRLELNLLKHFGIEEGFILTATINNKKVVLTRVVPMGYGGADNPTISPVYLEDFLMQIHAIKKVLRDYPIITINEDLQYLFKNGHLDNKYNRIVKDFNFAENNFN